MRKTCFIIALTISCSLLGINTWAKDNAVILLYHHVSITTPEVTSVSPDTFRQHMQYLADNHKVLPLKQVINALQNRQPLPDKTVVITFDDGYDNIYDNAHPILKIFGFPYTIFINPPLIGEVNYQLDWQQVKLMSNEGATFANHGSNHGHLLMKNTDETEENWLNRTLQQIESAEKTLKENLGYSLKYFAYPYGEFDPQLKNRLNSQGYVGFAQHSGAIASYSDFSALPRYPAAGMYSNIETLKVKLNSLAMPVTDISPSDPKLELPYKNQKLRFTIKTKDLTPQQISCFQNGQLLNKVIAGNTLAVEINPITQPGRHRINCTAPSVSEKDRYYWFSHPFFAPTAEGKWLD
ncbi:polysaccharide deacetylase family protein [Paraglaciecola arctica]|uniref:Polysaccharide deacetylase family protein n=1 Tax=Paraglaciecola arctica BSs20135 TaxID=493475 RepID=K6Z3E8_9ALTE|nr:polysaccharide deacetylase family protein [Paraglaciecola arctica]GAC17955.1 polysaccharide deacetylase family protein [Paraglaciecola arctica BSs20135]